MTRVPIRRRRPPLQKSGVIKLDAPLKIERLGHDGRGVGYSSGKITFVQDALPGEVHRVQVTESKRNYQSGKSIGMDSDPSTERVAPRCSHYGLCGGCQIQHMSQQAQIQYKEKLLTDQLIRAGLDLTRVKCHPLVFDSAWEYRRRARLAVNPKGKVFAGFRTLAGTDLVQIHNCPVLSPVLNEVLMEIQSLLSHMRSRTIGHVELTDHIDGPSCLVRLTAKPNVEERQYLKSFSATKLFFQWPDSREIRDLEDQPIAQSNALRIESCGRDLNFSLDDFIQVNARINDCLITHALSFACPNKDDNWLDLFCGMGNFTFALAPLVKQVWGVEAIPAMIEKARVNADQLGVKNCEFIAADLQNEAHLRRLPSRVDGVLLDPPRAGAKEVLVALTKIMPARIVYISCDPATFARDADYLTHHGYILAEIQPHDMFPQTMHLETLALFVRQ